MTINKSTWENLCVWLNRNPAFSSLILTVMTPCVSRGTIGTPSKSSPSLIEILILVMILYLFKYFVFFFLLLLLS
uniref:Uncharacterized protein n=1 Tax=Anguilla anguilla TaxID=7936 RepID=A0A0E9X8Q7_ANGAN